MLLKEILTDPCTPHSAPLKSDISGENRHGERCPQHEPEGTRQAAYFMRAEKNPHQPEVEVIDALHTAP